MFEQKIIKLAQNESDIMVDLVKSENDLNALNEEMNSLTNEYANNLIGGVEVSFFSLDNIYFWFVLIGLLVLAFSFIFLIVELKKPKKKKERIDKIKNNSNKETKISNIHRVEHDYEAEEKAKKKPKGPVKIKVLKIK